MDYEPSKVDDVVLALLFLNLMETGRAWKGFDWDSLDRLRQRGLISNPKSKAKSVELTEEGAGKRPSADTLAKPYDRPSPPGGGHTRGNSSRSGQSSGMFGPANGSEHPRPADPARGLPARA
jgi:hypothetical protein